MMRPYLYRTWVIGMISIALTVVLYRVLPYDSQFVESVYSNGAFRIFRWLWDATASRSPIALIYILVLVILYYVSRPFWSEHFRLHPWRPFFRRLVIVVVLLFIAFYWMWGFNYKRSDLRKRLGIATDTIGMEDVFAQYAAISDTLTLLRDRLPKDIEWVDYRVDQQALREDLWRAYDAMNIDYVGCVRIRMLYPKGSLLRWSTAGVYLPFVGEGHIDPGLHPITHPFTMMHEMSHGYGWTGEDICNFLALMAAVNSPDPVIQYSGYMAYWRYLRSNAFRADPDRWKKMGGLVSDDVAEDYREIMAYADRYPDMLPLLRDMFYDNYLKSHGIKKGLVSYSEMVRLAHAWKRRYGSLLIDDISSRKENR